MPSILATHGHFVHDTIWPFNIWQDKFKSQRRKYNRSLSVQQFRNLGKESWQDLRRNKEAHHFSMFRSHFVITPGLRNMPRWFQAKPQIPVLMKEAIFILNYVCKRLRVEYKRTGKVKQIGDVIWSGGFLNNRIFSSVGHYGEWHFKRARLIQKSIKWTGVMRIENALDKT